MQISWSPAARAPTSGPSAAIWRWPWGPSDTFSFLRRTAAGPFREEAAISLSKLEALGHIPALLGALAPVETALDDIPALALTEAQADRLRQGQPVLLTRDVPPSGALLRAEAGSRLVALVRSDGVALKPVRVFNL